MAVLIMQASDSKLTLPWWASILLNQAAAKMIVLMEPINKHYGRGRRLRSRTPGPPPFSSMICTPAASRVSANREFISSRRHRSFVPGKFSTTDRT
jgi:hypothetical protein